MPTPSNTPPQGHFVVAPADPAKVYTNSFGWAMEQVCDGGRVRRKEWPDAKVVLLLSGDGRLCIWHGVDGKAPDPVLLNRGDLEGADWERVA